MHSTDSGGADGASEAATPPHPSPDDAEVVEGQVVPAQEPKGRGSRRLDVGYQETRYTSPLPPPEDLRQYMALLPDAPERLLAAGEREQAHRHQIENRLAALDEQATPKYFDGQRRGHYVSLVLGVGYELLMLTAILKGYALEGVVGASLGVAGMVWAARRDTNGGPSEQPPTPSPPPDQSPDGD